MNKQLKNTGGKIAGIIGLITLIATTQTFAQNPVNISIGAGYAKGNNKFNITIKDTPGTKLELYVNDKNPTKATVNKHEWATFNKVKLSGTGKLSFTKVINGKQHPINYTRTYTVENHKVSFSSYTTVSTTTPAPAKATTPTPAPAPATPKTLLSLSGSGIQNSAPFLVTKSQLTVIYSYDCSSQGGSGNFIADLEYGNQSSQNSDDDTIANALSSGATNVTTTIYPQDPGHDYYLAVNSECNWTVTVND